MGDDYLLFNRRSNRWIGDNPPHRRKLGWSPPNDGHHFCVPVDARLGGLAWSSSGDSVNCDAQSAPSSIRVGSPEEYFLSGRYFNEGRDRDCYLARKNQAKAEATSSLRARKHLNRSRTFLHWRARPSSAGV